MSRCCSWGGAPIRGGAAKPLPIDATAALIKKGGKELSLNKVMKAEVAKIDRSKVDSWIAVQFPQMLRQQLLKEVLGPFPTAHLTMTRGTDGSTALAVNAEGDNAESVANVVKELNQGMLMAKGELAQEMARNPAAKPLMQPMADALDTFKLGATGKQLSATMTMPKSFNMMMPLMLMLDEGDRHEEHPHDFDDAPPAFPE